MGLTEIANILVTSFLHIFSHDIRRSESGKERFAYGHFMAVWAVRQLPASHTCHT